MTGYDSHGLPIENAVLKTIKGGRAALSPAELRQKCEAFALSNLTGQENEFKRLGVWGDFAHPYITLNKEYEAEQLRVFAKMADKGYLYKGLKAVSWCPTCETALAEEGNNIDNTESKRLWLIDPIDGTTNYAHAYPFFAVSIGLKVNDTMSVGVVYNPCTNELFTASAGCGAFLNGQKIKVSTIHKIGESLLATGFSPDSKNTKQNNKPQFNHITDISHGVRRDGAASLDLAYVACGRLDAFWEYNLKPWDLAAGSILVTEAGGKITDISGNQLDFARGNVLASNNYIHQEVLNELSKASLIEVK